MSCVVLKHGWINNEIVGLPGKKIFRCDRNINISNYKARPTAGGVCIYMKNNLADHTVCYDAGTKITKDFEMLTLVTKITNHRYFVTICVYKPPKGKIAACIEFLNNILVNRDIYRNEI